MGNEITTKQSFEDRIIDRIKQGIGDMMTDEELKSILSKGVEKVFFEPRFTGVDRWGTMESKRSLCDEVIANHLEQKLREVINEWVKSNPDAMQNAIESTLKASVAEVVMQAINARFEPAIRMTVQNMKSSGMI